MLSPEQKAEGMLSRHREWTAKIRKMFAPRLTREGLHVMVMNAGAELADALDQTSPMAQVYVDDPTQFLIKQIPTALSWLLRWKQLRRERSKQR